MGKLREDIPLEHYPCQWLELEYPFTKKKETEKFIQWLESIFKHEIVIDINSSESSINSVILPHRHR